VGAGLGAVTAIGGFLVVTLGAVVYTGVTESWGKGTLWLLIFLMWVAFVAGEGAVCGLVGAALARPTTHGRLLIRSLRTAALRSLRGQ
jgi:hypothetical protein